MSRLPSAVEFRSSMMIITARFGAVLSIICGFLMVIYTWTHLQQCIVVERSFLRMLKLCKLEGGSYLMSRCVRPWIKLTLEYPFKIPVLVCFADVPLSVKNIFFCVAMQT